MCGVAVESTGYIARIEAERGEPGASGVRLTQPPSAERVAGFVVPGMPNAHSHAFQRGMAGNTEYRLSSRDSFWTWRQAMYALANRITPAGSRAHRGAAVRGDAEVGLHVGRRISLLAPPGRRRRAYAATNELWEAVASAADTAGIALTFLADALSNQRLRLAAAEARAIAVRHDHRRVLARRRDSRERGAATRIARAFAPGPPFTPCAPCRSRRCARRCAASRPSMRDTAGAHPHRRAAEGGRGMPREHRAAGRSSCCSRRACVNERWCLVHATHATPAELQGIAAARRRGLRLDQHRGQLGRRLLRCGALPRVERPHLRRLRQPGDRMSRGGAALDGVPGATAQAPTRRARGLRASRTSAPACGATPRVTGRRPWVNPRAVIAAGRACRLAGARSRPRRAWPARARPRRSTT